MASTRTTLALLGSEVVVVVPDGEGRLLILQGPVPRDELVALASAALEQAGGLCLGTSIQSPFNQRWHDLPPRPVRIGEWYEGVSFGTSPGTHSRFRLAMSEPRAAEEGRAEP